MASSDPGTRAATTVAASNGQAADGSASRNAYPDWAAAIVPAYTSNVRTTDTFGRSEMYEIITADPYETVLAWYKAHVKTTCHDLAQEVRSSRVRNTDDDRLP
jgi:hypothetical protein